jgi:hypothetical protein
MKIKEMLEFLQKEFDPELEVFFTTQNELPVGYLLKMEDFIRGSYVGWVCKDDHVKLPVGTKIAIFHIGTTEG